MSEEVGRKQCPSCAIQGKDTAQDNLVMYSNGWGECFACGYKSKPVDESGGGGREPTMQTIQSWPTDLPLTTRGIPAEIAGKYGVRVLRKGDSDYAYAYPLSRGGKITGYQVRKLPKEFMRRGDTQGADLFGWEQVGESGQMIVVCEGQDDKLAADAIFQSLGKAYKTVASLGTTHWKKNLDKLEAFDKVMICFDQDEAGQEAAKKFAESLSLGKGRIVKWSGAKDVNDLLLQNRAQDFLKALGDSKAVRPDGIVSGSDTWERLQNKPIVKSHPFPDHWVKLNDMTKGIRLGELDTWTSGSGMGKSAILKELLYHVWNKVDDGGIGVLALEEPVEDSVEGIMSLHVNKRIHLMQDDYRKQPWYRTAWEEVMGTGRWQFFDHWGSARDDTIINKIRYMARGLDCKYILLDHLSIVVSEFADEGNERQMIDALMSKLKSLTQELDVWIGLVVHLRKASNENNSFERGGVPTLDDLRGSAAIKQLSNQVYALSRDQQHENPYLRNTTQLHVLKSRFTGMTGPADMLYYDGDTGRMILPDYLDEGEME